ncbi:hypothetical protein GJV26_25740 [Massilia dura]|uniref:Uncharacterized protein n=1 Tax=Pseudoduganella dura TaxID=321982 RepID=A0A6I3XFW2_9BURK|nr:hypothetical protein [Pseudoduganella dura]MUI15834.1 hypothetical protein [Pseudoduganella dura]GGX89712.1 hypothetical protein GCM10007386_20720 [Pseudoduganella dura]
MQSMLYIALLAAGATAQGASGAAAERALVLAPAPGAPASGDTVLLARTALPGSPVDSRAAADASAAFLGAVKSRDCNRAMNHVDAGAYRLGPGDRPAHCLRMFASFERFGAFTAEPPLAVSGAMLVPLKPPPPAEWRVLTFRKTGDRWLFSEQQEAGSLVPLVLSAFRNANRDVQKAQPLANVPSRTVVLDDQGTQGRLALRARIVPGPADSGPTAALMSFYAACTSREGLEPGALGRYLACLRPDAQALLKASHEAAPAHRKIATYNSLTAARSVDYVLVDGSRAVIFFTETASSRHWRDVVHQTGPGTFALDNPMKSGSVDMALNGDRVRAAIKAQAR